MIINIKSTGQKQADPDPGQKYVLKSMDRKSRTPFAIGLLLASFVLYLKSFLSSSPSDVQAAEESKVREGDAPPGKTEVTAEIIPLSTEPEREPDIPFELDLGGTLADYFSAASIYGASPEPFAFELNMGFLAVTKPMIAAALAANDNYIVVSGPAPMRSSGGSVSPGQEAAAGPEQGGTEEPPETDAADREDEEEEDRGNRAPRGGGPITLWDLSGCAPFLIGLSDLLGNAVDPDGDALSVHNIVASHGTLTWAGDHWEFQSGPGYEGIVTLTYDITDSEFAIGQIAYINVRRNVIEGTDRGDPIVGTDCGENIDGRAGDDNIYARGGDDIISGGEGDDHIVAGEGDDIVFGGSGNDVILGGPGNDHIFGESGGDYLSGDDGDDIVFGGEGDDRLYGGAGRDVLDGGDGDDIIEGGPGNDVLMDGTGSDRVAGGDGDDLVIAAADSADDHFDGGAGFDTLDYSASSTGMVVDLTEGVTSGDGVGTDSFVGFEAVVGGTGDDHFIAAGGELVLAGGGGGDVFEFLPPDPVPASASAPSSPASAPAATHMIIDFSVGDRVRMSKYDIFEKVLDQSEDRFEEIYGDDVDDDDIAIRYRHDHVDELSRTVIEVDFNNDGVWETAVMIEGMRALVIIEHA